MPAIADSGDYDQAVITLKFPNGTIANIELSRFCSYGYDQRLEVSVHKGINGCCKLSYSYKRKGVLNILGSYLDMKNRGL